MKRILSAVALLAGCSPSSGSPATRDIVEPWEHGYKTEDVVATRYKGPFGHNIGFTFPRNLHNYDAPEVFDFFTPYGGTVIEGGGAPGAEMLVVFHGVNSKDKASAKILQVLPELSKLMRSINDGTKYVAAAIAPLDFEVELAKEEAAAEARRKSLKSLPLPDSPGYWWVHRFHKTETDSTWSESDWCDLKKVCDCYPSKNDKVFYDAGKMLTIEADDNDTPGYHIVHIPVEVYVSQQKQYGDQVEFIKLTETDPFASRQFSSNGGAAILVGAGEPMPKTKPWVKPKPDVPWSDVEPKPAVAPGSLTKDGQLTVKGMIVELTKIEDKSLPVLIAGRDPNGHDTLFEASRPVAVELDRLSEIKKYVRLSGYVEVQTCDAVWSDAEWQEAEKTQ